MPLSTSSSSRLPGGRQWRTWALVPCLLAVVLLGTELFSRHLGFRPSLVDSAALWSLSRDQVYERDGKKALVILGASRAQTGLDPELIGREFPGYRVIHLSLDGTTPLAILRDLCLDPEFDGSILCSATVELMLPDTTDTSRRDIQYVDFYRHEYPRLATRDKRYNAAIKAGLQSRLAVLSERLSFHNVVISGPDLRPNFLHLQPNRYRPSYYRTHFTEAEIDAMRSKRVASHRNQIETPDESRFEQFFAQDLKDWNEALTARGGKLVLLRMPCSGDVWQLDQATNPKAVFWDRIQVLSGVPTVHFVDFPGLDGFTCPDGSHLDASDSGIFSSRLAVILRGALN